MLTPILYTIIAIMAIIIWRNRVNLLDPVFCKKSLDFAKVYQEANEEHIRLSNEIDRQFKEKIKEAKQKRFITKRLNIESSNS